MAEIFNRLLLVDLDGTIREPASGKKFIQHPLDQRIIAGADKAIAHYHQEGYQIIGITNQGGVAAGHKSLAECFEEQRYTLTLFPQMLQICACSDWEGKECWVINQVSPVPIPALDFGYEGADFRSSWSRNAQVCYVAEWRCSPGFFLCGRSRL